MQLLELKSESKKKGGVPKGTPPEFFEKKL